MKRIVASLLLTAAVLACAPGGEPPVGEAPVRRIPLKEIYTTFDGNRLKHLPSGTAEDWRRIYREYNGGANVFLVSGRDIEAAVRATRYALTGASAPMGDKPVPPPDSGAPPAPSQLWLVACLGTSGSSPPLWRVSAVELAGSIVRLSYSQRRDGFSSMDACRYFLWVPLGQPTQGTYSLEMYDADEQQVALLRRVTVTD